MRKITQVRSFKLKLQFSFWDFTHFNHIQYKQIYFLQDIFKWTGKDRNDLSFSV